MSDYTSLHVSNSQKSSSMPQQTPSTLLVSFSTLCQYCLYEMMDDSGYHLKHYITRQIWGIWKLRPAYSPETPNLGQNRWCFVPCDFEIWWMTLENKRASLLCCFKLCATFHSHWWIQTGVTVRKRPIWVKFNDFFRAVWPWNLTYDLEKQ